MVEKENKGCGRKPFDPELETKLLNWCKGKNKNLLILAHNYAVEKEDTVKKRVPTFIKSPSFKNISFANKYLSYTNSKLVYNSRDALL